MARPLHAITGTVDAPVEATWQALLGVAVRLGCGCAVTGYS